MDDPREPKDGADPRRSIAAFLEAARQEGLLSDADADTLGAFHQRLLSPPPVAGPTDDERRTAERLIRDLGTTRTRMSGRSRALLSAAIAATTRALRENQRDRLITAVAEARRALAAATRQPEKAASRPEVASEPDAVVRPPPVDKALRSNARALLRALSSRRADLLEDQRAPVTSVVDRLGRVVDRSTADELKAAIHAAQQVLEQLGATQQREPAAPPAAPKDPTRLAAQAILFKLKARYQRSRRRDRDRLGAAIGSLSRALDARSEHDVENAMGGAMDLLGIRPVAPETGISPPAQQRTRATRRRAMPVEKPESVAPVPAPSVPKARPPAPRPVKPRPRRVRQVRPERTGPTRLQRWSKGLRDGSNIVWSRITADVAANTLTYLGVVLSIVVVYVFYVYDYFGQLVDAQHRPLWFIGTIFLFLGMARMLRRGTSIPSTATAVEMIGLLAIPMMLSGFFRDGCNPGVHVTCMVPDVDGPARWMAYAAVGLVTAGVYHFFARRRRIYAYLVAPMLWMTAGALGLYLEEGLGVAFGNDPAKLETFTHDGISGWQAVAVLVAVGLTIAIAGRYRNSSIGKDLAVPTVRAAVVMTPFVLALGFVLAYFNDTLAGARPSFADLSATNVASLLAVAGVFAFGSRASFAWEGISATLQRQSAAILRAASYLAVGLAWVMSAAYEISVASVGLGLIVYAFAIVVIDRLAAGAGNIMWIVRLSAVAGAALTLLEPMPALIAWAALAAPGVLSGRFAALDKLSADLLPTPDHVVIRRLRLWVPLFVAIGAGAARLVWPDGTSWVLAGVAAAFAAARLAKRSPDLVSLARFPATAAALAAVAIQAALQIGGDAMNGYEFGSLLFAVGLVAAAIDVPWALRLPATTGLLAAGTSIVLREAIVSTAKDAAWVDTAALAAFGLALIAGVLLHEKSRGVLLQGGLGHAFVLAAVVRSFAFEETTLLGLGVVAVAYAAEAVAIELGRRGFFNTIAARAGRARATIEALPTLVVTAVMLPIALLAGRHVPFIRAERPRFGPVLSAVSWVYLGGAWLRRARMQRIVVPFAYLAAVAGIAVAVPSTTAILSATWSAAIVTALLAMATRRPYTTTASWGLAVTASVMTAVRLGVDRGDAHFVLHAAVLLLLLIPAVVNARKGRPAGLPSAWLRPPVAIGLLLLPATIALAIGDSRYLAVVALTAATAYAVLGWATRTGGVSIPVAFTAAIAYATFLSENDWAHPFDEPVAWMPLAALYVAAAMALPGCRSWQVLEEPAPGIFLSGFALGGLALILSFEAGVTDLVLASLAGVLLIAFLVRRHDAWLAASVISLVASGFIAGGHWPPVVAAAVAIASGVRSDQLADLAIGNVLRWLSMAWWAAAFGLAGAWQHWNETELVIAASIASAVVLVAATTLTVATSWPDRARRWAVPTHALGQLSAATVIVTSVGAFGTSDAYGTLAGVALAEAALAGLVGTVRRNATLVSAAGALVAASYAFTAAWQAWTTVTLIAVTAAAGTALLTMWTVTHLVRLRSGRLRLWMPVIGAAGQAALVATLAATWMDLGTAPAAGVTAWVLAFEALGVGLIGTIRKNPTLVAGAGILTAAAYGFTTAWLEWDATTFIAVTAVTGAGLLVIWTGAQLTPRGPERLQLWIPVTGAATQAAAGSVLVAAWIGLEFASASGITAGFFAAGALAAGVFGTVRMNSSLVVGAGALAAATHGFATAWLQWDAQTFTGVTAAIGVVLLIGWTAAQLTRRVPQRLQLWVPVIGVTAQVAVGAAVAGALAGFDVQAALGVTAGVLAAEAIVSGLIGTRLRIQALVWGSAGLIAAAYGFVAAWLEWDAATLISATSISGALAMVAFSVGFLIEVTSKRLALWIYPFGALAQTAAVTIVVGAWAFLSADAAFGITSAVAAAEALLLGVIATRRRDAHLTPIASAFAATSYGFLAAWLDWPTVTVIMVTAVAGGILLAIWEIGYLRDLRSTRFRLWIPSLGGTGLAAAVAIVGVAGAELTFSQANGVFSGVAWYLAVLIGILATVRPDPFVAGTATALGAAGYGFGASWLGWDAGTFVSLTGPLGAALLITTTYVYLTGTERQRLRIWLPSASTTGHVALVAAIAVAVSGLTTREMAGVISAAAAFEAVVLGVVGATRRNYMAVLGSSTLTAVAYWFATVAADTRGAPLVGLTGAAAAAAALVATALTRRARPGSRLSLWIAPAHGLAVAGGLMTLLMAGAEMSGTASLWAMAVVSFGAATYLAANAGSASDEWALRTLAAVAYVASAGLSMAWSAQADAAPAMVMFGIAALALAAAASWSAPGLDARLRSPLAAGSVGFGLVALLGAWSEYGANSSEFASVLLILGAALATHGLLTRRLRAVEAAVIVWLIAGLLLIDEQLTLTLHATVVLMSVTLLAVLEIERQRRRTEKLSTLDVLNRAEWVLMIAPLAVAAYSMSEGLWYAIVLFGEGLLLTGWGAVSRIRRRAFIGFGGAVMAILLSVAIPVARGIQAGITEGTWLLVAAVAALVFIVVGSTIERQRAAIGRQLRQLGEILEDWE